MDQGRRNLPKSLSMAFWNANGLSGKIEELKLFASSYSLDVILVSETKLRDHNRDPKIPGYQIHRRDRPYGPCGGVAIYVRKPLKHSVAATPDIHHLEATGIRIEIVNGPLRLFSCYNRPRSRLIDGELLAIVNDGLPVIAAGDFNAKNTSWHCRTTNANGRALLEFASNNDATIVAPVEPTHHNTVNSLADIFDIAITRNVRHQIRVTAVNELSSDHCPVLMHVGNEANEPESIRYAKIDWSKFTDHLDAKLGNIPRIIDDDGLEQAVEWLETGIVDSVEASTTRCSEPKTRYTVPQFIVELIRNKNRARRIAHRTGFAADRTEANRQQFEVKKALIDFRNEQWEQKLESLTIEDNSIWKMTKLLRNNRKPLPPIHGARGMVYTDEEKVEAFAENLELLCSVNLTNADLDHVGDVEDEVEELVETPPDIPIPPTTPEEISEIIRKLKNRKAPGPDNIGNRALKRLPEKALVALTGIANGIFRVRHFPQRWKTANVIFIPKPGKDPKFPQNHRPISLLSSVGKVIERLIHSRLASSTKNSIPDEQFGFRPKHSTQDQLLRVTEFASVSHERNHVTGAVFLDVAKAFDTVWHAGLVHKLRRAGASVAMAQLIHSLDNRSFRAKMNNVLSTEHPIEAGVPQGSVLSPHLYAVYTADIPKVRNTTLAIYADDTAIIARSKQPRMVTAHLQNAINALETWFRRWLIDVNPEKSSALLITRRRLEPHGHVRMFGQVIPWKDQAKYLGVVLDKKLSCTPHIDYVVAKTKMVAGQLSSLTCRKSKMSPKNKLVMYKTIIRPTLTYTSIVWGHAAGVHLNKMQVVLNRFLRTAFDAPWFVRNNQLHRDAELPMLKEFVLEIAMTAFEKAKTHPNPLVREAVDYDEEGPSRHKRPKMVLNG
jgi:hypothetical protein